MSAEPVTFLMGVAGVAWPAGLAIVAMSAHEVRRRRTERRRLNECLHELRRPLQALVLTASPRVGPAPRPLELALAALRDLDREINGQAPGCARRSVDPRALALAAAQRWRPVAARDGREVHVRWSGPPVAAIADPVRVSQSLDNLLANALEHGSGPITIEGGVRGSRLRLLVRDAGPCRRAAGAGASRDPRHGHGLRITRRAAERQGGAFSLRIRTDGTHAVLELPLAAGPAALDPHRR